MASDLFLQLVRLGINHEGLVPKGVTGLLEVKALADAHRLTAVVLDGLDKYLAGSTHKSDISIASVGADPSNLCQKMRLEWIGEVIQNYEGRYVAYEKALSSLARFYNQHGYKMMVLKGYACALDWPKPNHRPCGDIDIWLFGKQKEADKLMYEQKRIKADTSEHHHTTFSWEGFVVENHFDFLNVHQHRSSANMEKILKELGEDDSYCTEILGEKVYLPSPNLHALFLLRHSMTHFVAEGITLRQLMDWGFYVEKHGKEIDWEWLTGVLRRFGMMRLFQIFNAICVGDLGFNVKNFPSVQFEPTLKDKVLKEILYPKYSIELPQGFFKRVVYKYHRWRSNEWKYHLCFTDSVQMAFLTGVWNHLTKPKTI